MPGPAIPGCGPPGIPGPAIPGCGPPGEPGCGPRACPFGDGPLPGCSGPPPPGCGPPCIPGCGPPGPPGPPCIPGCGPPPRLRHLRRDRPRGGDRHCGDQSCQEPADSSIHNAILCSDAGVSGGAASPKNVGRTANPRNDFPLRRENAAQGSGIPDAAVTNARRGDIQARRRPSRRSRASRIVSGCGGQPGM